MSLSFEATISSLRGRRVIRLPEEVSAQLPSRGMVMAQVSLAGRALPLPLEPDGQGGHWLELPGDIPAEPGQRYPLTLSPLADWPEPPIPDDISAAIRDGGLQSVWESLTTKARWEWLRWIRATNNQATRHKRVQVACSKLSQGDKRPCCFNSASCTVAELSKSGVLLAEEG